MAVSLTYSNKNYEYYIGSTYSGDTTVSEHIAGSANFYRRKDTSSSYNLGRHLTRNSSYQYNPVFIWHRNYVDAYWLEVNDTIYASDWTALTNSAMDGLNTYFEEFDKLSDRNINYEGYFHIPLREYEDFSVIDLDNSERFIEHRSNTNEYWVYKTPGIKNIFYEATKTVQYQDIIQRIKYYYTKPNLAWELRDSSGTVIDSGTYTGGTIQVNVTDEEKTLVINGYYVTLTTNYPYRYRAVFNYSQTGYSTLLAPNWGNLPCTSISGRSAVKISGSTIVELISDHASVITPTCQQFKDYAIGGSNYDAQFIEINTDTGGIRQRATITALNTQETLHYYWHGDGIPLYVTINYDDGEYVYKMKEPLTADVIFYKPTDPQYDEQDWYDVIDTYITITPPSTKYDSATTVNVSIASSDGLGREYSINGGNYVYYNSPFDVYVDVGSSITVDARLYYLNEFTDSATYQIRGHFEPVISPESGGYVDSVTVTMTNPLNYPIYYTLDGSTPISASTLYTGAITITSTTTVKAISYDDDEASDVAVATYHIIPATPTITPTGGTFTDQVAVTITDTDANATIYYTIDGSTPTSASTQYTGQFNVTGKGVVEVKAVAYKNNEYSQVATAIYTFTPDKPVFTPSGGSHQYSVTVTITDSNNNPVYYTTDGSTPTTGSTLYTQPVTFDTDGYHTLKAISYNTVTELSSEVTTGSYNILTEAPVSPTFNPEPGTYPDMVKVSLYCEDTDAVIYYTLDGTTPTTGSTVFNQPILINGTTTIKAMAYDENFEIPTSEITTGTYTISHPARSRKAPRNSDNFNGIYVKNVTYSGDTAANYRSAYVLPSAITVTDTEADVTWGYHIDNVEEDMGDYGTKCKVNDTEILIHLVFTHMGKQYTLEKTIPCVCVIDDAIDSTYTIQPEEAYAICTLENKLRVIVKARVRYTAEETTSIVTNLDNFTLSGTSTNGNFICNKSGSYFLYDDILTLNYSGSVHPANDVLLTLVENSTGYVQDKFDITVTFETGSIFEVRDDAIRMAVQASHAEISGVTNNLTQLELNLSGITGTVSALTNSVSGISADVSQLQQTASSLTSTVYNLSGEMVTHSEIQQISTAITMNVFNEIGEKTGIDISGGTITLDASKTIVTGELEINDGIAFYDQYGNPAVSIGGDELGVYDNQTNGSINYRYLYVNENNTTGYSFTTEKDSLGQYNSGDTITYQYLAIWDTITPNGSTQSQWDESTAVTCQIQLYLDNNSDPFDTYTATLTGATNTQMKSLRANPIREFTIPSGGTIYAKYAITSQGTSQIGTRHAQVSVQVGSKQANTVNIRKGGINIGHAANYMTFLGADDTVLRKGTTGFKYGKRDNANGIPQIAVSTYKLLSEDDTFSEHPDNIMPNARVYWTPTANYTWHTSSFNACDTYYGKVQGYTSWGDRYNARIREDKLCGDLWLDALSYGATDLRGEKIMLLLPPTTRQDVVDNKAVIHSLPEGYTVRILNMGFHNGVDIVPNLIDGYSVSEGVFYLPNGKRETNIYFNANDTFIELVYAGTYTLSDVGMRQQWYVRNWNNL